MASVRARHTVATVVAVAATCTLVGTSGGVAMGSAHPHPHPASAATPKLKITMSKKNFVIVGPHKFQAGRVDVVFTAVGNDYTLQLASFKKGYTFADLRGDLTTFGQGQGQTGESKAGLKALNHAVDNTVLYGGLDADSSTIRGSFVLPKPGTYYLYDDSGDLPARPKTITVTGPQVKRPAPAASATVTATNAKRFGGSTTLPAKGTIVFKNASTNSPHMLIMFHVKTGTTRKQVLDYLESGSQANPPWGLPGGANTDILSPGLSQTLTYSMPKGQYAELCFFPDLQTGMPHAFMGMIRMVTAS
jgi:hypothetical protein